MVTKEKIISFYLQLKYIKFLPLQQFTDKGNRKFNFRCPICGDSKRSTTKKRCWATEYKNSLHIKCYNCGYSSSFHYFLKTEFPTYYADYIKEKFNDAAPIPKKSKPIVDIFATEYDSLSLQKVNDLPPNHKAIIYLRNRKITAKMSESFYYSDNFSKWLNDEIDPNAINFKADLDRRIVIPFYSKYKKIFAVQGRSIDNIDPKYITFKMDKNESKIFGLDRVDFTKTVYVVEGPLDSIFIPNCLAVGGALGELYKILSYTSKDNIVIIPDNEKRNYQTSGFINKAIQDGFKVVVWDKNIIFKDINEAVEKGLTIDEILAIVTKCTFKGLMATTKFKLKGF